MAERSNHEIDLPKSVWVLFWFVITFSLSVFFIAMYFVAFK
jgi:hypothetical protein